jgi:hypothetical protein
MRDWVSSKPVPDLGTTHAALDAIDVWPGDSNTPGTGSSA